MEVYTPLPEEALGRVSRGVRIVGVVVLLAALAVPVAAILRYRPQPDFHIFGTVQTRFGTAEVVCGAEVAPPCGEATGLAFAQCTPDVKAYFNSVAAYDDRARALLGKRPPTGSQWYFTCGWAPRVHSGPAKLESN